MKKIITNKAFRQLSGYLAATVTVAVLSLAANALSGRAKADSSPQDAPVLATIQQGVQLAQLHLLEEAFHQAGSYGGDIDAMMALWADDSTLTVGSTVFSGKDAIRAFFAAGGPFQHYWVGLTPAFKFTADIKGDTAQISFQCDYVDPSVTPAAVRLDRILAGTVKNVEGKWLFWQMASLPATL
jgi:ketosteroid isomerase-like protein